MFRPIIYFRGAGEAYRRLSRSARIKLAHARTCARWYHARLRWARWAYTHSALCERAPYKRHDAHVLHVRRWYRQAKLL